MIPLPEIEFELEIEENGREIVENGIALTPEPGLPNSKHPIEITPDVAYLVSNQKKFEKKFGRPIYCITFDSP